jgi:hypothetical protein
MKIGRAGYRAHLFFVFSLLGDSSMAKTRLKLSQAIPALALAAAVVAPMPQALSSLSAAPAAQAATNPCAPSNPCAPGKKMGKTDKKAGNPCAPSKKSDKKATNPCAPSK